MNHSPDKPMNPSDTCSSLRLSIAHQVREKSVTAENDLSSSFASFTQESLDLKNCLAGVIDKIPSSQSFKSSSLAAVVDKTKDVSTSSIKFEEARKKSSYGEINQCPEITKKNRETPRFDNHKGNSKYAAIAERIWESSEELSLDDIIADSHHTAESGFSKPSGHKQRETVALQTVGNISMSSFDMDKSFHDEILAGAGDRAAKDAAKDILDTLEKLGLTTYTTRTGYASFDLHNLSKGDTLFLEDPEQKDTSSSDASDDDSLDNDSDICLKNDHDRGGKKSGSDNKKRHKPRIEQRKSRSKSAERHGKSKDMAKCSKANERVSRSRRIARSGRCPGSSGKNESNCIRRAVTTEGTSGVGKEETSAPLRRHNTSQSRNFGARPDRGRDRTRAVAGQQVQRISAVKPLSEEDVLNGRTAEFIMKEEQAALEVMKLQEKSAEEERKVEIETLKKALLSRGPSVSKTIARTVRNNPELLDRFLREIVDKEDTKLEITARNHHGLFPASALNGVDNIRADRRRSIGERSLGVRQVRSAQRDSTNSKSGVEPGFYKDFASWEGSAEFW